MDAALSAVSTRPGHFVNQDDSPAERFGQRDRYISI